MAKSFQADKSCSITDSWKLNEMPVVYMENEWIKVGILAGRGSDIFEFIYKPLGLNLMLRLDKDIINPQQIFTQNRGTNTQFEDYYYGGWQEILPNSAPMNYRGASLGQHGEISLIPWEYAIIKHEKDEVCLKLWTRPLRFPILIEKELTLKIGDPTLYITELLTNESDTDLDIMWGHHIAFGLPFLTKGGTVKTNAKWMEAEPSIPAQRQFSSEEKFEWPTAISPSGIKVQADKIEASDQNPYSELAYLSGFGDYAWYSIRDAENQLEYKVTWDPDTFKCLWFWQERYATQGAPWWGKAYAIALEPWSSKWTADPQHAIDHGEWLKLKAREKKSTWVSALISIPEQGEEKTSNP